MTCIRYLDMSEAIKYYCIVHIIVFVVTVKESLPFAACSALNKPGYFSDISLTKAYFGKCLKENVNKH